MSSQKKINIFDTKRFKNYIVNKNINKYISSLLFFVIAVKKVVKCLSKRKINIK